MGFVLCNFSDSIRYRVESIKIRDMEKTFDTKFGEILLRNAMLDIDGTTLESGIEIKLDDELIAEVTGSYFDIEDATTEEVEEFVEKYVDSMYER